MNINKQRRLTLVVAALHTLCFQSCICG